MKRIIFLGILSILLGCASETEQASLNQIAQIYDAETSYTKGFSSSVGKETIKRFTIKAKGSVMVDTLSPNATSANMALLVYDGFEEKEKNDYTQIDVELISTKGDTSNYFFPVDLLERLSEKSEVYRGFSEAIIQGNATEIDVLKSPERIPNPVGEQLLTTISDLKNEHGVLMGFEPFGILENRNEGKTMYQFNSFLNFNTGTKIYYYVIVDATPKRNKVEGFRIFF
ncbi:MAG: hypothetical protein KTR22_05950 [Flavobacteriaceae bacterium]|nr:hypothetical protein [Flavobacteriaceae bacterium]